MADPVIALTASAIATLAFQEFIKSGAGELARKFSAEAIAKMSELRKKIWDRLRGKHPAAEDALTKTETGDKTAIETVGTLLGVEMLDPTFAAEVRAIAQEIHTGKPKNKSRTTQNNYDNARCWRRKSKEHSLHR